MLTLRIRELPPGDGSSTYIEELLYLETQWIDGVQVPPIRVYEFDGPFHRDQRRHLRL
jgi:hypothetical protein